MTLPLLLSLTLLGCGDDKDDTAGDAAGPALGTLTLTVYDGWIIEHKAPAPGYVVALDDGDGQRTELTSDGDGQVVFEVDWSLGPVDVIVDGVESLHSVSGIDKGTDDLQVFVTRTDQAPDTVTLSGTLSSRTEGTQGGVWMLDELANNSVSWGETYAVTALADEPLLMLALEGTYSMDGDELTHDLVTWKLVEHDAASRDTTIDIDLAEADTPSTASGSVLLPDDERLHQEGTSAWIQLNSGTRIASTPHGWITWGAPTEDRSGFDFDVAWMDLPDGGQVNTVVQIAEYNFDHGSIVMLPSTPDAWQSTPVMMPTPTLEDPGDAWEGDRIFHLEAVDEVEAMRCVEVQSLGQETLWFACSDGSDEVRLPDPPSTADPDLTDRAYQLRPWLHDMEPFDWYGPSERQLSWGPVERL